MENSSFFLLSGANFFYYNILAQLITSYFSFIEPNNISNNPTAEYFTAYSTTPIVFSLISNPESIATPLNSITALITLIQAFPNNIKVHEDGYKYRDNVKFFTILSESIMIKCMTKNLC